MEKSKLYRATHTQAEMREKWCRVVYDVRMIDNRAKLECECRLFEHMGMACCHMLKVMDVLGFTEILQQLIGTDGQVMPGMCPRHTCGFTNATKQATGR